MLPNHSSYFDITDPNPGGDTLILTKILNFPRFRKQLTSMQDFSQLMYGDIEIEIGLLDNTKSQQGRTIREFFDDFLTEDPSYPDKKCLVIVDSGSQRWAGFVYLPIDYDLSYANKSDGFKVTVRAFDAMVEWKKYAETVLLPYHYQLNTSFRDFLKNQVMNYFFLDFQNDVDPTAITGANCILNRHLHAWCLNGGHNQNYTRYNLIKGLAVEWGLVYKFEVPESYEGIALGGDRVPLTFRLMRRTNGKQVTMQPKDYYRTQLPKIDKNYILLVNRKYNLSFSIEGDNVNAEIVHGLLIGKNVSYNLDSYNMYGQGRHGFPNTCFIMSANSSNNPNSFNEYYANKIIVRENDVDVLKLNPKDVQIVENEMFTLNLQDAGGPEYSLKFGNSNIYKDYHTIQRRNSRITATRLFCSFVEDSEPFGINDIMYQLNFIPLNELKVLLKNSGSIKGITSILNNEPDMFDWFIVPYEGVEEKHSIIRIDPNYNFNDGDNGLTAEYQTVRIG